MAVYTQLISSYDDGETIYASLFTNEFNQIIAAFDKASGHNHDGITDGSGAPITTLYYGDNGTSAKKLETQVDGITVTGSDQYTSIVFKQDQNGPHSVASDLCRIQTTWNEGGLSSSYLDFMIADDDLDGFRFRAKNFLNGNNAPYEDFMTIKFDPLVTARDEGIITINGGIRQQGQQYNLFVRDDTGGQPALYVQHETTTGKVASFRFGSANANGGTEVLGVLHDKIEVTGGVTADYLDLTGGKSTTTTGAICADQIRFSAETSDEAKIYASVDGLNTSLFIQSADDVDDKVRVVAGGTESLTVTSTGIEVTGTVTADALTVGSGNGQMDITADANNTYITQTTTTGNIYLDANNFVIRDQADQSYRLNIGDNDGVKLYANNAQRVLVGTDTEGVQFKTGAYGSEVIRAEIKDAGLNVTGTVDVSSGLNIGTTLTMSSDGTNTTINEIGDGQLLVGANEYIFRTSDGSTSAVDATPTELNRMILSSGDNGGVFIYGGNASPVATDTGYVNHTAAFYNTGGLALSSPPSSPSGGWFECQNSITVTDTDGGTESFPDINLKRNSPSPADNDNLGSIEFWGNRVGGTNAASKYGQVRAQIENVSTGVGKIVLSPHDGTGAANAVNSSMGSFQYSGVDGAATNTKAGGALRLTSADDTTLELSALDSDVFSMSGGLEVTGTVTADLVKLNPTGGNTEGGQIEFQRAVDNQTAWYVDVYGSGTDTSLRFVDNDDANNPVNRVVMNNTGINVTGVIDCDTSLQIRSSATADNDAMPDIYLDNQHVPADNQNLGMIQFRGFNDAVSAEMESYATIYAQQVDVSDGAEKGKLVFQARDGAGYVEALQVTKDGIDVTGKVECKDTVAITTTGSGTDPAPDLDFINLHPAAVDERLGQINYYGMNDESGTGSGQSKYAWTEVRTTDITEDFEKAQHETWVKNGASHTRVLTVKPTGIDVTGTVTADGLTLGAGEIATFNSGAGGDLQISGDATGSFSLIKQTGGGDLIIQGQNGSLKNDANDSLLAWDNARAELYWRGNGAGARLATTETGIDVTGDLDVTGTITSNAFAYSKATVNNAADILYTAFNSFAGKRIINTASATNTTYGLPTPVAADIGKSWIICNPTDSLITIDHDASGTANYVWIMDGVTLSAAASSWTIKKGAIVEIVVAAAAAGGGSATAPNYLIFGAGLLEL